MPNPLDPSTPLNAPAHQAQAAAPPAGNPLDPANPFLDPEGFRRQHGMQPAHDPIGDTVTKAVPKLATSTSQALDFQRERLWRKVLGVSGYEAQSKALRHLIPGAQAAYDWHMPDTGIGPVDTIQHHANDLANNLFDAAMWLPLDPLTWETFGVGGAGETAAGVAVRSFARATAAKALNRTFAGRLIYKHLGPWGSEAAAARGAAAGDLGKGLADVETAQGAGHAATAEGQRWEAHVTRRVNEIVNGVKQKTLKKANGQTVKMTVKLPGAALTDAERMRVINKLHGEEMETVGGTVSHAPLTPRELNAYRQLRSLTAMDWKEGQRAATAYALRTQIPDASLRNEVASYFKSGREPVVPEPGERVKVPYGEPKPRARGVYSKTPPDSMAMLQQAIKDLNLNRHDQRTLSQALTDDAAFERMTDPEMAHRAAQIREAMAEQYRGRAPEVVEAPPAPDYNMVPKNQAEIERMTKVREAYLKVLGVVSKQQEGGLLHFRQDYMPMAHVDAGDPLGREGYSVNPSTFRNPRLTNERPDVKFNSPTQLERGFIKGLAPNLNRQVQTRFLNENIPDLLNDPQIEKLFESEVRATGAKRTPEQWASDISRAVVGWPRAALVSMSAGHAANEINMAASVIPLEDQGAFFKSAMPLAAKIFKAQMEGDTREYAALTAPGRKLGAGVGSFAERKPFFQDLPGKNVPVLGLAPKAIAAYTRFNNRLVWSISEAIRQKYAEYLVEHGEAEGLRAGGLAEKRLVDYQYRTPFQNLMRHIAPFGTYRGGIPGAVGGGVFRRPWQAATLNRATGGVMYGDKPQPGQPGWEAYWPTADVGRLANVWPTKRGEDIGPLDYAESSLSPLISGPVGLAVAGIQARQNGNAIWSNPLAYGQSWFPKRLPNGRLDLGFLLMSALSGIPQAQTILEANGISRFQWRGFLSEFMRQEARLNYTPPTPTATQAPFSYGTLGTPPTAGAASSDPLDPRTPLQP